MKKPHDHTFWGEKKTVHSGGKVRKGAVGGGQPEGCTDGGEMLGRCEIQAHLGLRKNLFLQSWRHL